MADQTIDDRSELATGSYDGTEKLHVFQGTAGISYKTTAGTVVDKNTGTASANVPTNSDAQTAGTHAQPGDIKMTARQTAPTGWIAMDGTDTYSRTTYSALFAAITFTDATVDTTDTDATITMDDTSSLFVGIGISGAGIPAGTTISSITNGTTAEMSANATATASNITATFLPWGVGNADTTFALRDVRGLSPQGTGTNTVYQDAASNYYAGPAVGQQDNDKFQQHEHKLRYFAGVGDQTLSNTNFFARQVETALDFAKATSTNENTAVIGEEIGGAGGSPRTGSLTKGPTFGVLYCMKT